MISALPAATRAELLEAIRVTRALPPGTSGDRRALADALYTEWFARARPGSLDARARMRHLYGLAAIGGVGARVTPEGGWWLTHGSAGVPPPERMMRVYWNCPPTAVQWLVMALTGSLERLRSPFSLKCPSDPGMFARVEPVVLYLDIDAWPVVRPALRAVHLLVDPWLRDAVPPLTLGLGRGAAAAQDPGDGTSFGESRSRAVADGLVTELAGGASTDDALLDGIARALDAHGFSVARPFLRTGAPAGILTSW